MRRMLALLTLLFSASAHAQQPSASPQWVTTVGASNTVLGDPTKFGTTGGMTLELGARRDVLQAQGWHVGVLGRFRGWGFEQPGPRTIGLELDAGMHLGKELFGVQDGRAYLWADGAIKGFRSPFGTALGRMRFVGIAPVASIGVGWAKPRGLLGEVGVSVTHYDTWVWTGQSYALNARIGGWW